ncbi:MAG: hypothetical protein SOY45_02890 [Lachnospiraceae bacterium]|nr:hypothetical protein [Lachnospiraceae bacterium]MDY4068812.1 hypothetical protein [Lachnospiraceae bacterium]
MNHDYFYKLAYDNLFCYQLKQFAALLIMWLLGGAFLLLIRTTLPDSIVILLAFPTGICLWAFASFFLLMPGIPYTVPAVAVTLLAVYVLILFLRRRISNERLQTNFLRNLPAASPRNISLLSTFLGVMLLCSTGILYVFLSYDSYFYFINYGNSLTILKSFADIVGSNSFTLTNIGQFLPLVNSYAAFWGLDQSFQIQAFLTFNLLACFFYGSLCLFRKNLSAKKALFFSALLTLFLASSTCFIILSSWVLANMYCMVYLFLIVFVIDVGNHGIHNPEVCILVSMFLTALSLLRKDGIIFAAFVCIWIALGDMWSKKTQLLVFLPAAIVELWWLFYVRIVLDASVGQAVYSSVTNNKNIFLVVAAIVSTCVYILLVHPFLEQLFRNRLSFPQGETLLLYLGMIIMIGLLTLRDWNFIVDNVDMTIRNMILFPSIWGISAVMYAMLIVITMLKKPFWDADTFLWLGYIILNFISYSMVDSKWFWVNWDDSYMRVFLQIVPVIVFICGKKLSALLRSYTPDHNSES